MNGWMGVNFTKYSLVEDQSMPVKTHGPGRFTCRVCLLNVRFSALWLCRVSAMVNAYTEHEATLQAVIPGAAEQVSVMNMHLVSFFALIY